MSMTFSTDVIVSTSGNSIKTNKVLAPTASGGSTYGAGSSGQVLKSNGTNVYWATDNNTTYSEATTSLMGLMSAGDKEKVNGLTAIGSEEITTIFSDV